MQSPVASPRSPLPALALGAAASDLALSFSVDFLIFKCIVICCNHYYYVFIYSFPPPISEGLLIGVLKSKYLSLRAKCPADNTSNLHLDSTDVPRFASFSF